VCVGANMNFRVGANPKSPVTQVIDVCSNYAEFLLLRHAVQQGKYLGKRQEINLQMDALRYIFIPVIEKEK